MPSVFEEGLVFQYSLSNVPSVFEDGLWFSFHIPFCFLFVQYLWIVPWSSISFSLSRFSHQVGNRFWHKMQKMLDQHHRRIEIMKCQKNSPNQKIHFWTDVKVQKKFTKVKKNTFEISWNHGVNWPPPASVSLMNSWKKSAVKKIFPIFGIHLQMSPVNPFNGPHFLWVWIYPRTGWILKF